MIYSILFIVGGAICATATAVCMYVSYLCGIAKFAPWKPDHPSVPFALEFMKKHGGVGRVERTAKTGISLFAPVTVLFVVLIIVTAISK